MWRSALVAGVMVTAVVAGCGGGDDEPVTTGDAAIPADAVAVVGDEAIPRSHFEEVRLVALATGQHGDVLMAVAPDARACATRLKASGDRVRTVTGEVVPPDELEAYCTERFTSADANAMRTLIVGATARGVADERGIEITDSELRAATSDMLGPQGDLGERARRMGLDAAALGRALELVAIDGIVQRAVLESEERPITDERISAYYADHRDELALPERREVRAVVVDGRADARAARAALERGQAWPAVVERYASDGSTRELGGRPVEIEAARQSPEGRKVLFGARRGELVGPARIESGWLIAEIVRIKPARERSVAEAREDIRTALGTEDAQQAQETTTRLRAEWRERTRCVPELAIDVCANGPEQDPAPAPAPAPDHD